jgi:hypothetical protein
MKALTRPRTSVGAVIGRNARFGTPPGEAFYRVELVCHAALDLQGLLTKSRDWVSRRWVTVTASYHDPNRLRVTHAPPPAYESRAADSYFRGDAMRVTGVEGSSINLDLSSRFAVQSLNELIASATARAKEFIVLRVPNRKRDLIEVLADVDLPTPQTDEEQRLGASGAGLAATVLPAEDFSDWEQSDG